MNKLDPDQMPGRYERRVFIGGNYDFSVILKEIRDFVAKLEFQPIFALDFEIPPGKIHDYDLRLLHNCRYAIFEVGQPAGELMEIERALDYNVEMLILYQSREPGGGPPPTMTTMLTTALKTIGCEPKGYCTIEEQREIIRDFLSSEPEESRDLFRAFLDAFGFQFGVIRHSVTIHPDGLAEHEMLFDQLRVASGVNTSVVPYLHHHLNVAGESAVIMGDLEFSPGRGTKHRWLKEEVEATAKRKSGYVEIESGLKLEDELGYLLKATSSNAFCFTKEQFEQSVSDFPFEFETQRVHYPTEKLIVEVNFFPGYKVNPRPIALHGKKIIDEAIREPIAFFNWDFKQNKASLTVKKPRIFYRYGIIWEPMPVAEYSELREKKISV